MSWYERLRLIGSALGWIYWSEGHHRYQFMHSPAMLGIILIFRAKPYCLIRQL